MAKPRTLTVNDAGSPEQLIASRACRKVTVYEDPTAAGWPRKWQWRETEAGTPAPKAEGGSQIFEAPGPDNLFQANELIAYLELLSGGGSTTFIIVEE